jgi:hypothetical protein
MAAKSPYTFKKIGDIFNSLVTQAIRISNRLLIVSLFFDLGNNTKLSMKPAMTASAMDISPL